VFQEFLLPSNDHFASNTGIVVAMADVFFSGRPPSPLRHLTNTLPMDVYHLGKSPAARGDWSPVRDRSPRRDVSPLRDFSILPDRSALRAASPIRAPVRDHFPSVRPDFRAPASPSLSLCDPITISPSAASIGCISPRFITSAPSSVTQRLVYPRPVASTNSPRVECRTPRAVSQDALRTPHMMTPFHEAHADEPRQEASRAGLCKGLGGPSRSQSCDIKAKKVDTLAAALIVLDASAQAANQNGEPLVQDQWRAGKASRNGAKTSGSIPRDRRSQKGNAKVKKMDQLPTASVVLDLLPRSSKETCKPSLYAQMRAESLLAQESGNTAKKAIGSNPHDGLRAAHFAKHRWAAAEAQAREARARLKIMALNNENYMCKSTAFRDDKNITIEAKVKRAVSNEVSHTIISKNHQASVDVPSRNSDPGEPRCPPATRMSGAARVEKKREEGAAAPTQKQLIDQKLAELEGRCGNLEINRCKESQHASMELAAMSLDCNMGLLNDLRRQQIIQLEEQIARVLPILEQRRKAAADACSSQGSTPESTSGGAEMSRLFPVREKLAPTPARKIVFL